MKLNHAKLTQPSPFIIDFLDANSNLHRLQWRIYYIWKSISLTSSSLLYKKS